MLGESVGRGEAGVPAADHDHIGGTGQRRGGDDRGIGSDMPQDGFGEDLGSEGDHGPSVEPDRSTTAR